MTTQEEEEEEVSQVDYELATEMTLFLGIDAMVYMKEQEEEEHRERVKMKKGFNCRMRSEASRLRTFVTYQVYSSWTPQDMAAAGFYFTGVKTAVQCFCCSLILFGTSLKKFPIQSHRELRPGCQFLLGRDVGNIGKYEVRVKTPGKKRSGDTAGYGEEEARLKSFGDWPFYVQAVSPQLLAASGFFFTGKRDTVQCFSCGGCLGDWEEGDDPWQEHAKWFPKCEYLQSKKSSEEIADYIQSYQGFVDVTGEHFMNSWVKRELPMASAYDNNSVFANEELRRETFKNWPHREFLQAVDALVRAGLFYTGVEDEVQCFSCGGCMKNWQEGDDPLADHTKYFPSCPFLQNMKSSAEAIPDLQGCGELSEIMEPTSETKLEGPTAVSSLPPAVVLGEALWFQEAKSLSEKLRATYISAHFRRLSLLKSPWDLPSDRLLGCDLALTAKRVSSPVQEPQTLPEVLANLHSVMSVEGVAGSGKTVLLKKIAFLWASGCCPLLNRFQLVFYLSLSSVSPDQGLAHVICDQLLATGAVSEMGLKNITRQLGHQVLFLLDDYKARGSVPQVMETLIQRSHLSRTCRLIAVRTNKGRHIRRHLHTILEVREFPFYNTISILRQLFPQDQLLLRRFMAHFGKNPHMQGIHKTPLFVAAVCAFSQPFNLFQSFDHMAIFKAYMECLFLKHKTETELFRRTVSSCGELALKGFLSFCFEFSVDDLTEAGVDEDEDLTMYLLSRFTAQRLRPVYKFLNPAFQEFLAGKRLSELLDSDRQEDQDLGLYYLKQINSPLMAVSYDNFLKYVASYSSTKVGPHMVSHLLHLVDSKESLENPPGNGDRLQFKEEMTLDEQLIRAVWQLSPEHCFALLSERLWDFAVTIAYESNTVATCAPLISKFLQGRSLTLKALSSPYFFDHPESLCVLKSVTLLLTGNEPRLGLSESEILEGHFDRSQMPTIDRDYASAFENSKEWERDLAEKEKNIRRFQKIRIQQLPHLSGGYWQLQPQQPKLPLLQVHVTGHSAAGPEMLALLAAAFSASQRVELHLEASAGFLESIRPALEPCKAAVTKCALGSVPLSAAEQQLLLALPALESLEVSGSGQVPVKLIENSPDLRIFHLNCNSLPDLESLMTTLASCKKLNEIIFSGHFFDAIPFVSILPNFTFLKILNLSEQQFPDTETAEKFADALGSLTNLEELVLPTGDKIYQVVKQIIQQCQRLLCLRVLSFLNILNDDSVVELAKVSISGGFQKLEDLNLSVNHKITQDGYRNFFQALDNLPNLRELAISRHFSECLTAQPSTIKALSQCVSRLPCLLYLHMLGWLLDAEDVALLDAVKERHPQASRLHILWKWRLPFSPIIQN
ncbi:baculoviral IAP repeat-containing protein 1 isoform X2 [Octodon degus]|uniref:Baculoviral IAP repeat-containing protein 1 isoform X2 n=1 Tax=Octodon degus TaxID=10160 RepID=A0A6P6DHR0_OCTDE|nr:baculoviral IAP repeat-containing protein 1 isoform X2 [Octodon degus]